MEKVKVFSNLIIFAVIMLIVIVVISVLPKKGSINSGDIIKGIVEEIHDEYIVVEVMDADDTINFVINEDAILYIYNGSSTKHTVDDWDIIKIGEKVEIRVGKYVEMQGKAAYYIYR